MKDDEIIAKWMGWVIDNSFPDKEKVWRSPKGAIELNTTFKYSTSWDWLMPVVEKINDLSIAVEISFSLATICKICYKKDKHFEWITVEDNDKIKCVYSACIEFIKWHNSQVLTKQ